jgi:hypothetical protein
MFFESWDEKLNDEEDVIMGTSYFQHQLNNTSWKWSLHKSNRTFAILPFRTFDSWANKSKFLMKTKKVPKNPNKLKSFTCGKSKKMGCVINAYDLDKSMRSSLKMFIQGIHSCDHQEIFSKYMSLQMSTVSFRSLNGVRLNLFCSLRCFIYAHRAGPISSSYSAQVSLGLPSPLKIQKTFIRIITSMKNTNHSNDS